MHPAGDNIDNLPRDTWLGSFYRRDGGAADRRSHRRSVRRLDSEARQRRHVADLRRCAGDADQRIRPLSRAELTSLSAALEPINRKLGGWFISPKSIIQPLVIGFINQ